MRYEALARENARAARPARRRCRPVAERWLPAEIVNIQLSSLRQRLLLNRGAAQRRLHGPGGARRPRA